MVMHKERNQSYNNNEIQSNRKCSFPWILKLSAECRQLFWRQGSYNKGLVIESTWVMLEFLLTQPTCNPAGNAVVWMCSCAGSVIPLVVQGSSGAFRRWGLVGGNQVRGLHLWERLMLVS